MEISQRSFFDENGPIADGWSALRNAYRVRYGAEIGATGPAFDEWVSTISTICDGQEPVDSIKELLRFSSALVDADADGTAGALRPVCFELPVGGQYPSIMLFKRNDVEKFYFGYEADTEQGEGPMMWSYDTDVTEEDLNPDDPEATVDQPMMDPQGQSPLQFMLEAACKFYAPAGAYQLVAEHSNEPESFFDLATPAFGAPFQVENVTIYEMPGLFVSHFWENPFDWRVNITVSSREVCEAIPSALMALIGVPASEFDRHDWA